MRRILPLLVFLLMVSYATAKVPDSAWQTGTLKDLTTDRESKLVGLNGMLVQAQFVITHYFIESSAYIYEADLRSRAKDKQPPVTVNGSIKFALVGNDLYIQDEGGKEHKLMLVKKTLKSPAEPRCRAEGRGDIISLCDRASTWWWWCRVQRTRTCRLHTLIQTATRLHHHRKTEGRSGEA